MDYTKVVLEHITRIEQSSGQVNPAHKRQLQNSKEGILRIVNHLEKQIKELQSEISVLNSIKREGN